MSEPASTSEGSAAPARGRGRGRGKSRGGLGKYLRARGRGRGRGRPAEFGKRLLLEDEEPEEIDDEEQQEVERRFSRRQLVSNADRYAEPEPELNSEGEEVVEPEIDLSSFLERQKLSSQPSSAPPPLDEDDDVDTTLAHITSNPQAASQSKKGRVQQIEWDAELEELSREKAAADATRDLKARFRAQAAKQRGRAAPRGASTSARKRQPDHSYTEAPPLPTDAPKPEKSEKADMEDFLDDLLN
ncbi:uncharacterized protein TRAVEDRAFT_170704 [Trametes versicolor FP-101664 SS1]|uniref:uncharacterized protein n=1 Tax=Trametes versicolor (strain FP-101664) TaxID=717944 RepID=UPI000462460A|nr:uncharacterized protein TRAVEDRAFT_170704 [Trametes versicolor FP-101664 SS1]EIW56730.1 hypothetical protein TRAVEDRAFT_170704 [Trametes versicolor FP-101664 SS1]